MDSFIGFVVIVIVWLAAGSIGASLLTRKHYLTPENPGVLRPDYTHRTTAIGVPMQYFVAFFGPVTLIAGLFLPQRHGGKHA